MKVFSLAAVRHASLSRFWALLLITLSALPFTAPFAVLDLTALTAQSESPCDSKTSKESTTAVSPIAVLVFSRPAASAAAVSARPAPPVVQQARPTILRL